MPLNTFDLQRMQDIQIGDTGLREEYISKYQDGSINYAHSIISDNATLHGKALTANIINAYKESIVTLESSFYEGVVEVLDSLQDVFQDEANKIIYLDDWQQNESYEIGNFVLYDNEIYLCIKAGTYDITDTTAWNMLEGLRGLVGVTGTDVYYIGTYDSTFTYQPKQIVTYNNKLYISKTVNTSKYPDENPDDWTLAVNVVPRGIDVGVNEPEDIYAGRFWWKQYDMEE